MLQRYCALTLGILFLLLGIAGFVPNFLSLPAATAAAEGIHNIQVNVADLAIKNGYGNLFGLFPTNVIHNIVHIIVGILGIAAYTSFSNALLFNRGFAIAYAVIAIMGLLPFTNTTFGLMPIFGNNVWLNALTAGVAAYFGFAKPASEKDLTASNS